MTVLCLSACSLACSETLTMSCLAAVCQTSGRLALYKDHKEIFVCHGCDGAIDSGG